MIQATAGSQQIFTLDPDLEGVCGQGAKFTRESSVTYFESLADASAIPALVKRALDAWISLS